jgi:hypothetical protein
VLLLAVAAAKGQLISKGNFGAFRSIKKANNIFVRISNLAFNMDQIIKLKLLYYITDNMLLFF